MTYDIRRLTLAADNLLKQTTNSRHRKILSNYRRHAMLEVSGRYHDIFTTEMTVENPFYRLALPEGLIELEGKDAIKSFYQSMVEDNATIIMLEQESLVVNDWGFGSEALYHTFMPGKTALAKEYDVVELNATYIETRWVCMVWPYDDAGRMMGERVYPAPTATLRKCPPDEVLTLSDVRKVFDPILAAD